MRIDLFFDEGLLLKVQNEDVLTLGLNVVKRVESLVFESLHHCLSIILEVRLAYHRSTHLSRLRKDGALGHVDVVEEKCFVLIPLRGMIDSRQVEVVKNVGLSSSYTKSLLGHRHLLIIHLPLLVVLVVIKNDLGVIDSASATEVILLLAFLVEELHNLLFNLALKLVQLDTVVKCVSYLLASSFDELVVLNDSLFDLTHVALDVVDVLDPLVSL